MYWLLYSMFNIESLEIKLKPKLKVSFFLLFMYARQDINDVIIRESKITHKLI